MQLFVETGFEGFTTEPRRAGSCTELVVDAVKNLFEVFAELRSVPG